MEQFKVSSGNSDLDLFLNSGYDNDVITTLYGPSGSGKTTLCMLASINMVKTKKKVIYIDTESSFSVERLKQVEPLEYENIMKNIFFLRPSNFEEQQKSFFKLKEIIDDTIGLIVIDTISMLYRLALGQTKDIYEVNKKLGMQLAYLTEISRKKKIPILITNQVYANFEEKEKVNMVGGDILKYSSKTLIELQSLRSSIRSFIIRKSRSLEEDKFIKFQLVNNGIKVINPDVIPI
ncbi:MAG: DNA repair and recombination protein RadB [Candidatus Woesearchaeota archaeon]